jgi:hypothetical protein
VCEIRDQFKGDLETVQWCAKRKMNICIYKKMLGGIRDQVKRT